MAGSSFPDSDSMGAESPSERLRLTAAGLSQQIGVVFVYRADQAAQGVVQAAGGVGHVVVGHLAAQAHPGSAVLQAE